ncbi:glycerate-2-kinase family protein, partial [Patescibacteria group bacterium]|nr:glycerate-2-kinase family protein [Patescibacteria group bacterium]
MSLIKNFQSLAKTREREVVLSLVEAALDAIQPENVLKKNFDLDRDQLTIQSEDFNLKELKRIFLIGFGKGSARFSKILENLLGQRLNGGNVIDVVGADFKKITFCQGAHPLPSKENIDFTRAVLADFKNKNLCEKDLVFVVVAGGGSVLFEAPARINLDKLIQVNQALLLSGADIYEINTIRKHISLVKAGGLARALYPAK